MGQSAVAEYVMPEAEAQRLTNRITLIAGTVREGMEKLYSLVDEAKQGNAHVALGYPSWTAYLADTLGQTPLRLDRGERQEVVGYLAGEGMSTRAIAGALDVARNTVKKDMREVGQSDPPEPPTHQSIDVTGWTDDELHEQRAADEETQDAHEEDLAAWRKRTLKAAEQAGTPVKVTGSGSVATPAPSKVTGMDGKTYTRPERREAPKPKRRPLTDVARDAGIDLRKALERLERITEDDRYAPNKEQVTAHLRGHLLYAVEVCQDLLDHHLHEGA